MSTEFKPFTLEIEITSLNQLKSLWLLSDANADMKEFLNKYKIKTNHFTDEDFKKALSFNDFCKIDDKLKEFGVKTICNQY